MITHLLAAVLLTATVPAGTASTADWPGWQKDLAGTRHNSAEWKINQHTAGKLKLKWAFTYEPGSGAVRSQPAVVGDTIFFGGPDGKFRARDARTGAEKWTFTLPQPGGVPLANSDGPVVARGKVYFGTYGGHLFALDQRTGAQVWHRRLDDQPTSVLTSSPIVHDGRVYVGVSSGENTLPRDYPCCRFRGHLDALDADTGAPAWRYYTVPEPQEVGTWPNGAKRYEPSGAGVWSSPVIDPRDGTLYVGTGQNYTGVGGDFDTLLALDIRTGRPKWKNQVIKADTWRTACNEPDPDGYCPGLKDGTNLDYDIGATSNLFTAGGRKLVGVGQKSGVYHVFDARTGEVVWRRQLGVPLPSGGISGIPLTGKVFWETPAPADGCTTGGVAGHPDCAPAHGVPVSSTPGVVFLGGVDGKLRAYSARTGAILWTHDTVTDVTGVNGLLGRGGSIAGTGGGAVISRGMVYLQSGYSPDYGSLHPHVLLAFGL